MTRENASEVFFTCRDLVSLEVNQLLSRRPLAIDVGQPAPSLLGSEDEEDMSDWKPKRQGDKPSKKPKLAEEDDVLDWKPHRQGKQRLEKKSSKTPKIVEEEEDEEASFTSSNEEEYSAKKVKKDKWRTEPGLKLVRNLVLCCQLSTEGKKRKFCTLEERDERLDEIYNRWLPWEHRRGWEKTLVSKDQAIKFIAKNYPGWGKRQLMKLLKEKYKEACEIAGYNYSE